MEADTITDQRLDEAGTLYFRISWKTTWLSLEETLKLKCGKSLINNFHQKHGFSGFKSPNKDEVVVGNTSPKMSSDNPVHQLFLMSKTNPSDIKIDMVNTNKREQSKDFQSFHEIFPSPKAYHSLLEQQTSLSQNDLTLQKQPSISQNNLTSQKETSISQNNLAPQQQSLLTQNSLMPQKELTISQNKLTSQKQSSISQNYSLPQQQTSISKNNLSSQKEPSISQNNLTPQKQPSISQNNLTSQNETSISQNKLTSQKQSSISQNHSLPKQQPSISQNNLTSQKQSSISQNYSLPQQQTSISKNNMASQKEPSISQSSLSSKQQSSISKNYLTSPKQPSLSQSNLSSKQQPSISQNHSLPQQQTSISKNNMASISQSSLSSKQQLSISQNHLTSQKQPLLSQSNLSSKQQPSISPIHLLPQQQTSISKNNMASQKEPSISQSSLSSKQQPSISQNHLTSQKEPSLSQSNLPSKPQPSVSQNHSLPQQQTSTSKNYLASQKETSISQSSLSSKQQPSISQNHLSSQKEHFISQDHAWPQQKPSIYLNNLTSQKQPLVSQNNLTSQQESSILKNTMTSQKQVWQSHDHSLPRQQTLISKNNLPLQQQTSISQNNLLKNSFSSEEQPSVLQNNLTSHKQPFVLQNNLPSHKQPSVLQNSLSSQQQLFHESLSSQHFSMMLQQCKQSYYKPQSNNQHAIQNLLAYKPPNLQEQHRKQQLAQSIQASNKKLVPPPSLISDQHQNHVASSRPKSFENLRAVTDPNSKVINQSTSRENTSMMHQSAWDRLPVNKQLHILEHLKQSSGNVKFIASPLFTDCITPTVTEKCHTQFSQNSNQVVVFPASKSKASSSNSSPSYKTKLRQSNNSGLIFYSNESDDRIPLLLKQFKDSPVSPKQSLKQPKDSPVSAKQSLIQPNNSPVSSKQSLKQPKDSPVSSKQSLKQPKDSPVSSKQSLKQPKDFPVSSKQSLIQPKDSSDSSKQSLKQPKDSPVSSKQSLKQPKDFPDSSKQSLVQPKDSSDSAKQSLIQNRITSPDVKSTTLTSVVPSENPSSTGIVVTSTLGGPLNRPSSISNHNITPVSVITTSACLEVTSTGPAITQKACSPSSMPIEGACYCENCHRSFAHKRSFMFHKRTCHEIPKNDIKSSVTTSTSSPTLSNSVTAITHPKASMRATNSSSENISQNSQCLTVIASTQKPISSTSTDKMDSLTHLTTSGMSVNEDFLISSPDLLLDDFFSNVGINELFTDDINVTKDMTYNENASNRDENLNKGEILDFVIEKKEQPVEKISNKSSCIHFDARINHFDDKKDGVTSSKLNNEKAVIKPSKCDMSKGSLVILQTDRKVDGSSTNIHNVSGNIVDQTSSGVSLTKVKNSRKKKSNLRKLAQVDKNQVNVNDVSIKNDNKIYNNIENDGMELFPGKPPISTNVVDNNTKNDDVSGNIVDQTSSDVSVTSPGTKKVKSTRKKKSNLRKLVQIDENQVNVNDVSIKDESKNYNDIENGELKFISAQQLDKPVRTDVVENSTKNDDVSGNIVHKTWTHDFIVNSPKAEKSRYPKTKKSDKNNVSFKNDSDNYNDIENDGMELFLGKPPIRPNVVDNNTKNDDVSGNIVDQTSSDVSVTSTGTNKVKSTRKKKSNLRKLVQIDENQVNVNDVSIKDESKNYNDIENGELKFISAQQLDKPIRTDVVENSKKIDDVSGNIVNITSDNVIKVDNFKNDVSIKDNNKKDKVSEQLSKTQLDTAVFGKLNSSKKVDSEVSHNAYNDVIIPVDNEVSNNVVGGVGEKINSDVRKMSGGHALVKFLTKNYAAEHELACGSIASIPYCESVVSDESIAYALPEGTEYIEEKTTIAVGELGVVENIDNKINRMFGGALKPSDDELAAVDFLVDDSLSKTNIVSTNTSTCNAISIAPLTPLHISSTDSAIYDVAIASPKRKRHRDRELACLFDTNSPPLVLPKRTRYLKCDEQQVGDPLKTTKLVASAVKKTLYKKDQTVHQSSSTFRTFSNGKKVKNKSNFMTKDKSAILDTGTAWLDIAERADVRNNKTKSKKSKINTFKNISISTSVSNTSDSKLPSTIALTSVPSISHNISLVNTIKADVQSENNVSTACKLFSDIQFKPVVSDNLLKSTISDILLKTKFSGNPVTAVVSEDSMNNSSDKIVNTTSSIDVTKVSNSAAGSSRLSPLPASNIEESRSYNECRRLLTKLCTTSGGGSIVANESNISSPRYSSLLLSSPTFSSPTFSACSPVFSPIISPVFSPVITDNSKLYTQSTISDPCIAPLKNVVSVDSLSPVTSSINTSNNSRPCSTFHNYDHTKEITTSSITTSSSNEVGISEITCLHKNLHTRKLNTNLITQNETNVSNTQVSEYKLSSSESDSSFQHRSQQKDAHGENIKHKLSKSNFTGSDLPVYCDPLETEFLIRDCVMNPHKSTINGITFDRRYYSFPTTRLAKHPDILLKQPEKISLKPPEKLPAKSPSTHKEPPLKSTLKPLEKSPLKSSSAQKEPQLKSTFKPPEKLALKSSSTHKELSMKSTIKPPEKLALKSPSKHIEPPLKRTANIEALSCSDFLNNLLKKKGIRLINQENI